MLIALFTDFGPAGPYTGQVRLVLERESPGVGVVDLLCDAPAFDPRASAYLLAALLPELPEGGVCLAVVDPGVGGERAPIAAECDGRWLVGPDNGLFAIAARRARMVTVHDITWRPRRLSSTFHGRDLFAPVAAAVARGERLFGVARPNGGRSVERDWPDELDEVVYIDRFGNAATGRRASSLPGGTSLRVAGTELRRARTYAEVAAGQAFWYENSNGLVEIGVSGGRAAEALELGVGTPVKALLAT